MDASASAPALLLAAPQHGGAAAATGTASRAKELYGVEYWKEWMGRANLGTVVDPAIEQRKQARIAKTRADRVSELNQRGYIFAHPNRGWVPAEGRPDEPDSTLARALAGGKKVPLDYRPDNDHPKMVDLVGHNGDGVTGPFRSTYRGGPRRPRSTVFAKSARNTVGNEIGKLDVPFSTLPSGFGSRPQPLSKHRSAQSVSFGSGAQHTPPQPGRSGAGGSGPSVVPMPKSKKGGLFSGGGGFKTTSLRPPGVGEPGPGPVPNESLVRPTVVVPRLGRTDRWHTAAVANKHMNKPATSAMYDLPSVMGADTETPHVHQSQFVNYGTPLPQRIAESKGRIQTDATQSDNDPKLQPFAGFGFGCNLEEHIKYGCCLDGGCSGRSTWEKANQMRLDGRKDRDEQRARREAKSWRRRSLSRASGVSSITGGGATTPGDGRRSMSRLERSRQRSRSRGSGGESISRGRTVVSAAGTAKSVGGSTFGSDGPPRTAGTTGSAGTTGTAGTAGTGRTSTQSISTSLASARAKDGAVWGETPVHLATRSGEPDKLKHLLAGVAVWSPRQRCMVRKGRDINVRDSQNRTPLHTACYDGNIPMVKVLLDAVPKANRDAQDFEGNTPLHLAMIKGWDYVARLLIAAGCDPDIQNNDGKMPYNLATSHRAYQFAKEASMLVDVRTRKLLAQRRLAELVDRQRREAEADAEEEFRGVDLDSLDVSGKSVYASVARQLKDAALKKRRLFGSVLHDLADMFDAMDVDDDGHVSRTEMHRAFQRLDLGLSEPQIDAMMRAADADGNQTIERDEFFDAIAQFATL